MLRKKYNIVMLFLFCIGVSINVFSSVALSAEPPPAPIASTPCDTLYYESLSARAWMEAQREITQNQNIILKPDSVLEYTCFDMFARELAQHAENMLSETDMFGGPMSSSSMDNALNNLIGTSLKAYAEANFGHRAAGYDLLGGHSAAAGIHHRFADIVGGTYNCDMMSRVWQAAKCINFASHATFPPPGTPTDGFYTFQEYADITDPNNALDKRHRPTACFLDAAALAAHKAKWVANITAAYVTPAYTEDPVKTFIAQVTAPACAASPCRCKVGADNAAPIPTGLKVTSGNTEVDEKVCLQPGCHYNPPTGDVDGDGTAEAEGCWAR